MTKTAIAYLRVSTDDQTVLNQKLFLEQWAKQNGYEIIRWYEDPATSGTTAPTERPGFRAFLRFLKNNKVDAALVYELSRLGRKFWDSLQIIKEIDSYAPLIACSPKEAFLQNTDPSVRKLLIGIITWVAEREREVMIERIRAGIARARSQGIKLGCRGKVIDWQLFEKYTKQGMSIPQIAPLIGVTKPTLYRHVKKRLRESGRA